MSNTQAIANLQPPTIIVANGVAYLGRVVEEGSRVIIKEGMSLGQPAQLTADHLSDYVAAAYQGTLTETSFGASSPWSTTNMDDTLTISWEIAKLRMAQAIKTAPTDTVVNAFRSIQG